MQPLERVAVAPEGSDSRVPLAELAQQYADDTVLYCHTFFPNTVRQRTPAFHQEVFQTLDDPRNRQVAIEEFRGGGKTTKLRLFASKRIAYGISRTIVYGSASQAHSLRSVRWLRRQIEFNRRWTEFFGLAKGDKWTDEWLEIKHLTLEITITVVAVGITGQTRGINIDDYRPDLIVIDDPDDEESTGTLEQRKKTEERFFGAILNSLTPASENSEAKIVLLQTSLHKEDTINKCHADPTWITHKYSILTEDGRSRWENRYPTDWVLKEKAAAIARGQILLWLREWECLIGDEETAFFKRSWLRFWDILPSRMIIVITCDPAPPPSETQVRKGLDKKDEEVWSVQGLYHGRYFLLEQAASRDHDPEWSATTMFELAGRWKPFKIVVETVAYQRALKAFLERRMREEKRYWLIEGYPPSGQEKDMRKKAHRIRQAFAGIASHGALFVHPSQQAFISQFAAYPNVDHDDRLDAAAIGMEVLQGLAGLDDMEEMFPEQETEARLEYRRVAP